MIVFALATFGCTLPHFIYGNDLLHSTNAFYGGNTNNAPTAISTSISTENSSAVDAYIGDIHLPSHSNLCHTLNSNYTDSNGKFTHLFVISHHHHRQQWWHQQSAFNTWNPLLIAVCEEKTLLEQEAHSQIRNVILGIFFLSLLFVGIGQTAVSTLGIPYIDDNVASKESAVYIGNERACYKFLFQDYYLNKK